ncbi:MAG: winged helix DNA-binding domain-containing protein [Gammaproteobacteria bacterium]|nr:winged helix DNA-binding domain-containing protein [Gammaproteobacteria bacterium]
MKQPEQVSIPIARAIALSHQKIYRHNDGTHPTESTESAIQHLGYVQIDTISVVERAHHHVLWSRNRHYRHAHLDTLQRQGRIFEYWAHAASYLPMPDYRMYLPEMQRIREREYLWHKADPKMKQHVLERIRNEGPLRSRDFADSASGKRSMWQWKPAKSALETLFREGELMIAGREGFQKVFDLRERVLPDWVDTRFPSQEEQADFLIDRYLQANGFGNATQMSYLRTAVRPHVENRLKEREEAGQLIRIQAGDNLYHAKPDILDNHDRRNRNYRVRLLSPFDNLVIQRNRILSLFDFDYQIECYMPEAKRKYGYFCLPLLWNNRMVARMDCKAERKSRIFRIRNLVAEAEFRASDRFLEAFKSELSAFMRFNGCDRLQTGLKPDLATNSSASVILTALLSG